MKIHFIEIGDDFITFWGNPYQELLDAAKQVYKKLPEDLKAIQTTEDLSEHNPATFHPNHTPGVVPWKDEIGAVYRHFHVRCNPEKDTDRVAALLPEAAGVPRRSVHDKP